MYWLYNRPLNNIYNIIIGTAWSGRVVKLCLKNKSYTNLACV